MPNVGIIVIEKVFGSSRPFRNTYALQAGPFSSAPLNNVDLTMFVGVGVTGFTDANTDPSDPLWVGATSPIASIIAFDRLMTAAAVGYSRLYVSDGKTPGDPTGAFATFPLNFSGLALVATGPEDVAPLNIALQINRQPIGFSQRQGRLQMRAALAKQEVEPFTEDGVSLKPSSLSNVNARLVNAVSNSLIQSDWMIPGADIDEAHLVIPKYRPEDHADAGAVFGATPVASFELGDAIGRQRRRGRRERPATP